MLVRGDFSEREMDRLRVESTSEGQNVHITLRQAYSSDQIIDGGGGTGDDDFIYGSADNDRLNGRGGDDVVDGNSGDDDLFGGSGDDILRGEEGDDAIWAGSGDDIASGGLGNDVIRAGSGDDTVQGGEGNDRLYGGSGDDILVTGAGDKNVATGGCGADIFVFGSELANGRQERHRLTDFETGVDAIDLGGFEIEQIHSRSDSVVLWVGPDLDRIAVEGVTEISLIDFVEDTLL
jgi:Ca2+-binding RTX toxin-like protein